MQKIMFNDKYGLTQAVLNGCKTMTRRIIESKTDAEGNIIFPAPKYKIDEVIAIAQSYSTIKNEYGAEKIPSHISENSPGYRNKMFVSAENMPHHIKITGIKTERLQDISEEDCLREGVFEGEFESYVTGDIKPCYFIASPLTVKKQYFMAPTEAFACLIDKVSGKGTWESNHYVYVYEFTKETARKPRGLQPRSEELPFQSKYIDFLSDFKKNFIFFEYTLYLS